MGADRKQRLVRILELIVARPIHTQEELAAALVGAGYDVTQSSVSRDITALGLVKREGVYVRAKAALHPSRDPNEQRVAEGTLAVETSGSSLLVLRTLPGDANHVAVALDRLAWPEIVGTIAGDDTIFVAVRDAAAQRSLGRRFARVVRG